MNPEQREQNGIILRLHTAARAKNRKEFLDVLRDLENFHDDIDTEMRYVVRTDGARIKVFTPAGQNSFVTSVNDRTDKALLATYEKVYKFSQGKMFWEVFKTEYDMTEDEFQWVIGGL